MNEESPPPARSSTSSAEPHALQVLGALEPWSTGGRMPNFSAGDDPAVIARCYDEDTRVWLGALAERHDPAGVLRVGQVVRGA